jgi:hypothetical protein
MNSTESVCVEFLWQGNWQGRHLLPSGDFVHGGFIREVDGGARHDVRCEVQ